MIALSVCTGFTVRSDSGGIPFVQIEVFQGSSSSSPNNTNVVSAFPLSVLNHVLTSWGNDKLLPKDFKPISADEVKAERGKNLKKQQVYQIRKELKLVK